MSSKQKPQIECIYCGLQKEPSKEHVVQEGLGGNTSDCLTNVCGGCNSKLAIIDKALIVKSPLSLLVRRELGGIGPTIFDIDHKHGDRLLESQLIPQDDAVRKNAQIIFEKNMLCTYFSAADTSALGNEECLRRFFQRLRRAFGHYKIYGPLARKRDHKEADMIKLVKMDNSTYRQKRMMPRIHTNKPLIDFNHKPIMFELKHENELDKARVLDCLSAIDWHRQQFAAKRYSLQGSHKPQLRLEYTVHQSIQGITKIGFNLLARFSTNTQVNLHRFPGTVRFLLSQGNHLDWSDFSRVGFIKPEDIADLRCPAQSHKFRLVHDCTQNLWKLYAAFFEGKVGAYAEFHGPSGESWGTMDVIQPYKQPMKEPDYFRMYMPMKVRVIINPIEILSFVPFVNPDVEYLSKIDRDPWIN